MMLMSTVSNNKRSDIKCRMQAMANRSGDISRRREIKLCYVMPKRIIKDRHLCYIFSDLEHAGKLAQFVINEGHSVLQDEHDF